MPPAPSAEPPASILPDRKWFRWCPAPGQALWLAGLAALIWALRAAVITSPKILARARERWTEARASAGATSFKWEDAAVLGTHWSTLLSLGLICLAFLTMRWWTPARPAASASTAQAAPPRSPLPSPFPKTPWFAPVLAVLVLAGAAVRLPLASGSLWWDELWNIKYATVGEWRQDGANPDLTRFQPSSWARAAWYYNKPTNHPVLTLPSKAAHETWRALTGPSSPGAFREWVLRLPVLAGGLAAIVLTALLARRWAGDRAGVLAAALMAFHPWLIRYGVDARSYGLTVAFMAAALFALERATAQGTRRQDLWWWIFGGCQFLLMWSHVVANLAVCTGLFAAGAWLILRGPDPDKLRRLARLLVVNMLAAALLLVAFLPNLLQALTWGERNDDGNLLTGSYFLRTVAQMVSGMDSPPGPGTEGLPFLPWWGLIVLGGGGLAAAGAGLFWLFRTRGHAAWIPAAALAGTLVFLAMVRATDFYFYHRFILTAAVPLILLVAIGLGRLRPGWLVLLPLALFALLTFPQTRLLVTRSYAPFRETVALMKQEAARESAKVIPVGYGLGSHVMQCYYPELRDIRTNAGPALQALVDQARRENRPLILAMGYEGLNRQNLPEGFPLLDDPDLFERLGVLHGIEPEFTFQVLRLKPPGP